MKKYLFILSVVVCVGFSTSALALSVGTFGDIDYWVTDASRVAGSGGAYAGVDPIQALIGDDLTDGAINIGLFGTDSFLLEFSYGIVNNPGDDFVVFDGRFSSDDIDFEIDINSVHVPETDFVDSGLDFVLKNTSLTFDLYGASLDLSDWGIAENDVVYSMVMTSYYPTNNQADIMGVGVLNASIPDPSMVFLLGSACLLGFAGARKKFKK